MFYTRGHLEIDTWLFGHRGTEPDIFHFLRWIETTTTTHGRQTLRGVALSVVSHLDRQAPICTCADMLRGRRLVGTLAWSFHQLSLKVRNIFQAIPFPERGERGVQGPGTDIQF
eukprot:jgi/Botrbrau1/20733/Bobra.0058s0061.1